MTPASARIERARLEAVAVSDMNAGHACILLGGQALVIAETADGKHSLTSFKALSDWLACKPLRVPAVDERTGRIDVKRIDRALTWKMHEGRRNVSHMEFAPGVDLGADYYNTWKGWQVQPIEDDGKAAAPILAHIRDVWCGGDKLLFHWVLSWFAQLVQQPCQKPGTAIVLRGPEGAGKGVLAGVLMRRLLGQAYAQIIQPGQVTGRFNAVWASKLFVFADEAFWAGDKPAEGVLKGLISEEEIGLEYKGKDVIFIKHHARVIFASNSDWVVPAGSTARRYCVCDVLDTFRGNVAYHTALRACVDGDGGASFLGYLKSYDYSGVDLRNPPVTGALLDQKILSLESVPGWWRERLWSGYIDNPADPSGVLSDGSDDWPQSVVCTRLYASYAAYCKRTSVRYPEGEETFSRKLREFADITRRRAPADGLGKRAWVYRFGTDNVSGLHHQRGLFERWIGGALSWSGDEPRRDFEAEAAADRTAMEAIPVDELFSPGRDSIPGSDCPF